MAPNSHQVLTPEEIVMIRSCLDDGTYTKQEQKDFGTLCDMALSAVSDTRAPRVDRGDAVNLAYHIRDKDTAVTPIGIRLLADAVLRMDEALKKAAPQDADLGKDAGLRPVVGQGDSKPPQPVGAAPCVVESPRIVLTFCGLLVDDNSSLLNDKNWLKEAIGARGNDQDESPVLKLVVSPALIDQEAVDFIKARRDKAQVPARGAAETGLAGRHFQRGAEGMDGQMTGVPTLDGAA